jgi:hypothetical protein
MLLVIVRGADSWERQFPSFLLETSKPNHRNPNPFPNTKTSCFPSLFIASKKNDSKTNIE